MNQHPAIDVERDARQVSGQVADQEQASIGHVGGVTQAAQRNPLDDVGPHFHGELVAGDVCLDQAGRDRVDADVVATEFAGHGTCKAKHARLGRAVVRPPENAAATLRRDRRHANDAAALLLFHLREDGLRHVERAAQVHIDHGVEIGGLDIQPANFDAVVDVNLRGTLYMSQAVLPQMKEQKRGSIVCMSSVSAQRGGGIFGGPHYSAAKAGVLGLARAMAREFGGDNIRVNSITPGLIQTDITGDKLTVEMRADIIKGIPLGRLGDAADVANACLFLISDLSAYLTGITLDVNGGMLIH